MVGPRQLAELTIYEKLPKNVLADCIRRLSDEQFDDYIKLLYYAVQAEKEAKEILGIPFYTKHPGKRT